MDETRKPKETARIELPMPPIPSADIEDEATLRRFLDAVGVASQALLQACLEKEYAHALQPRNEDLSPYEERYRAYLADGRIARVVAEWSEKTKDPLSRSELAVLGRRGLEAHGSSREILETVDRIRNRMSNFRPILDEVETPLSVRARSLRRDRDREDREEAWKAIGPLHDACAADVRKLLLQRNAAAQAVGYPDAASLLLSLSDLTTDRSVAIVEAVEEKTRDPYARSLERFREATGTQDLRPWDVPWGMTLLEERAGIRFPKREASLLLDRTVTELGFDVEELPIRIRDAEIPYGGLCFNFYKPRESRILVSPTDGFPFLRALFHEYGHALHNVLEQETSPILAGAHAGPFGEGIAEVFAALLYLPAWHVRYLEKTPAEAEKAAEVLIGERLHLLRMRAMQFSFEIRAYGLLSDNPEADLDALALDTERRFLHMDPGPVSFWAAWAPLVTHPVFWQNYVIAACIADDIWTWVAKNAGGDPVGNTATAKLLTEEWLVPGPREPWPGRLERVLGKPLSADGLRVL